MEFTPHRLEALQGIIGALAGSPGVQHFHGQAAGAQVLFYLGGKGLVIIDAEPVGKRIAQKEHPVFGGLRLPVFPAAAPPQGIVTVPEGKDPGKPALSLLIGHRNIAQFREAGEPHRPHLLGAEVPHGHFGHGKGHQKTQEHADNGKKK